MPRVHHMTSMWLVHALMLKNPVTSPFLIQKIHFLEMIVFYDHNETIGTTSKGLYACTCSDDHFSSSVIALIKKVAML